MMTLESFKVFRDLEIRDLLKIEPINYNFLESKQ